jgi:hypothetical protein
LQLHEATTYSEAEEIEEVVELMTYLTSDQESTGINSIFLAEAKAVRDANCQEAAKTAKKALKKADVKKKVTVKAKRTRKRKLSPMKKKEKKQKKQKKLKVYYVFTIFLFTIRNNSFLLPLDVESQPQLFRE